MDMDYGARNADERDVEVTIRDAEQNREHDMVERKRLEAKTDFLTLIERSRYSVRIHIFYSLILLMLFLLVFKNANRL